MKVFFEGSDAESHITTRPSSSCLSHRRGGVRSTTGQLDLCPPGFGCLTFTRGIQRGEAAGSSLRQQLREREGRAGGPVCSGSSCTPTAVARKACMSVSWGPEEGAALEMLTSQYLEGSSPVGTPVEGGLQGPETTGVAARENCIV